MYQHTPQLTPLAKELRKRMTAEERHLWYDFVRSYPVRFLRQKIVGTYIVDFYCASAKLVVELDGSQHYQADGLRSDAERTAFLQGCGLKVMRIPNNAVHQNFRGVCEAIDTAVRDALEQQ